MSLKREPIDDLLPIKEEPLCESVAAVYVKKEPESFEVEIAVPVKKEIDWESGQKCDTIMYGDLYHEHKVKREVESDSDEITLERVSTFYSSNLVPPKTVCTKENSVKAASHTCYICLNTFTDESMLFTHICFPGVKVIHETLVLHRCDLCTNRYQNEKDLKRHQQEKHKKKLDTEKGVTIHKNNTQPNVKGKIHKKKLQPNVKEKQLPASSSANLVPEKPQEKFTCEICEMEFDTIFKKSRHMREHRRKPSHKCEICSKKYVYKYYLDLHVKQHQKKKLFTCGMCQKHLSNRYKLLAHMRLHTGVKPYSCDICQKSFTLSANLSKHLYLHMGGKPHACNLCQNTYALKRNLDKHMIACHITNTS